jgi:hypothetical protein
VASVAPAVMLLMRCVTNVSTSMGHVLGGTPVMRSMLRVLAVSPATTLPGSPTHDDDSDSDSEPAGSPSTGEEAGRGVGCGGRVGTSTPPQSPAVKRGCNEDAARATAAAPEEDQDADASGAVHPKGGTRSEPATWGSTAMPKGSLNGPPHLAERRASARAR